ncbi:unnamed protein product [Acanthoscelides obtectus]|uniref:Uncharacterized protein n=1 Tax=Acanthoscelides obtectus TaxID=200917 RepID=A0A9P0LXV3_ACAOB|nr:unnamed protein product [Acanthoscelides obtectus]CAK1658635.1 hypothetical protein AOBTE_LOCUS21040 [Acanthoscelides obtectus]
MFDNVLPCSLADPLVDSSLLGLLFVAGSLSISTVCSVSSFSSGVAVLIPSTFVSVLDSAVERLPFSLTVSLVDFSVLGLCSRIVVSSFSSGNAVLLPSKPVSVIEISSDATVVDLSSLADLLVDFLVLGLCSVSSFSSGDAVLFPSRLSVIDPPVLSPD